MAGWLTCLFYKLLLSGCSPLCCNLCPARREVRKHLQWHLHALQGFWGRDHPLVACAGNLQSQGSWLGHTCKANLNKWVPVSATRRWSILSLAAQMTQTQSKLDLAWVDVWCECLAITCGVGKSHCCNSIKNDAAILHCREFGPDLFSQLLLVIWFPSALKTYILQVP